MRENTFRLALGGIMTATAAALMFFGSLVPFATFIVPAAASLCVAVIGDELGSRMSLAVYAAVSVLSVLLAPDKEVAALFLGFFGYYPAARRAIEQKVRAAVPAMLLKLGSFNLAFVLIYSLLARVLGLTAVLDEFAGYTLPLLLLLLVLGNAAFILYDAVLTRFELIYRYRLRSRIIRR